MTSVNPSWTVVACALLFVLACDRPENGDEARSDVYAEMTAKRMTFSWKTDGKSLSVKVRAPTTGWVAVGFDPVRGMKNANIIIGYVKDGRAFVRDDFGVDKDRHQSDVSLGGEDDLAEESGEEENGVTEIGFTIPLDSGDPYDRRLVRGEEYKVLLSYGPDGSDNFEKKHRKKAWLKVNI